MKTLCGRPAADRRRKNNGTAQAVAEGLVSRRVSPRVYETPTTVQALGLAGVGRISTARELLQRCSDDRAGSAGWDNMCASIISRPGRLCIRTIRQDTTEKCPLTYCAHAQDDEHGEEMQHRVVCPLLPGSALGSRIAIVALGQFFEQGLGRDE